MAYYAACASGLKLCKFQFEMVKIQSFTCFFVKSFSKNYFSFSFLNDQTSTVFLDISYEIYLLLFYTASPGILMDNSPNSGRKILRGTIYISGFFPIEEENWAACFCLLSYVATNSVYQSITLHNGLKYFLKCR